MDTLKEKVLSEHIDNGYPNGKLTDYKDAESGLKYYSTDELCEVDADWFPLSCYKENGRLLYGGAERIYHTVTVGSTGAGKTTRFCIQAIHALTSMKNKPSIIALDPYGEIVENDYLDLVKKGYDVKIMNCDDPERSDTYNPLEAVAKEVHLAGKITMSAAKRAEHIAEIIQPVQSKDDPIWDIGARSYTAGAILDKLEDIASGKMPPEKLTIYNIIQNHYWLRNQISQQFTGDILGISQYREKGMNAISVQKMMSVTNNAEKTRASYFGVVENHYDKFGNFAMYALSSNSTVDLDGFFEHPTAIFISSTTNVGSALVSLLVNDLYDLAVKKGKQTRDKRLPRNVHCFLDEFANCHIADAEDFTRMLTTSRKFGMYWHLLLQCDTQLNKKYDPETSDIIRDNCTEIFMGSNDYITRDRFAKSCGSKTVEHIASKLGQSAIATETLPLITAEGINLMKSGEMIVKRCGCHPMKSYFEAFYNCNEFERAESIEDVYPYNEFDYTSTLFYPDSQPPENSADKFFEKENISVFDSTEPTGFIIVEDDDDSFVEPKSNIELNLEEYLGTIRESITEESLSELKTLTCVPDFIMSTVTSFLSSEPQEDAKTSWPQTYNVVKFEVIECFIKNNNFKTKSAWTNRMTREYETLKKLDIFPLELLKSFEDALNDIFNDFTLANIKEIKKLILQDGEE